ncbi:MAG: TatD family hydrolase [Promethearchaeota archaeon]
MRLIDVHSHLEWPSFKDNLDEIINDAKENGLIAVIMSGISYDEIERTMEILNKYKGYVYGCFGFAPSEYLHNKDTADKVKEFIDNNIDQFVGVGEIGLDYHYVKKEEDRKASEELFLDFMDIAMKHNKPIVIHSRDAEKRVIEVIEEHYTGDRVHMHCYSGPEELIKRMVKNGWMLSVPTSVVSRKVHQRLARNVPLENMMLETDAPFLPPYRKDVMKNKPGNIAISVKFIADLKQIPVEEVAETTTKNAISFYNLPL